MYGVGIIGAGGVFRQHGPAWKALGKRAKMIGLADVDAEQLERASHGYFLPLTTQDYRDFLSRDDVDIIDVCSPPFLHEQMVIEALEAGKAVVCEKPLANTLGAADRILEVARKHPNKLTVVYQNRFAPEIVRAVRLRDGGELGTLRFGYFQRYGKIPARNAEWWGKWEVAGGGALMTQFIHEIDLMLYLFGPAVEVTATMDTARHPIQSEDTAMVTVRFANGAVATGLSCAAGHNWSQRYDIVGDDASAHMPWALNNEDTWKRMQIERRLAKEVPLAGKGPRPGLAQKVLMRLPVVGGRFAPKKKSSSKHQPFLAAVLDALDAGGEMPVPAEDARASIELCVAMYTSALSGQPVKLPLDGSPYTDGITLEDYDGRNRRQE